MNNNYYQCVMSVIIHVHDRVHTKNCYQFSRTFQGPHQIFKDTSKNVISQLVQKCTFPVSAKGILRPQVFVPPPSQHFSIFGKYKQALKEHFPNIICRRRQGSMELVNKNTCKA